METVALGLAILALLFALLAFATARGLAGKVEEGATDARRTAKNASDEAERGLAVQRALLARFVDGESITSEMVREGLLFQDISGKRAQELIDTEDVFVLDVREPHETALGVLPGATLIPVNDVPDRAHEIPKDTSILVYCAAGARSAAACDFLASHGWERLYNLEAGYGSWTGPTGKPA